MDASGSSNARQPSGHDSFPSPSSAKEVQPSVQQLMDQPSDQDQDQDQPQQQEQQQPARRPTLLPAFEPFSSSPLAVSNKRKFADDSLHVGNHYPTPVPTSSTGILPSSPRRPGLFRTLSTQSERAPLSDVPTVAIPANGEPLLLGRSSNSCQYQLPYNRLISRVHVSVLYESTGENGGAGQLKIQCLGWNGCKVHLLGRVYELQKGDEYATTQPVPEIILDVQDTRVILAWPSDVSLRLGSIHSDSTWAEQSPVRRLINAPGDTFASSPPIMARHSPVSPTSARQLSRVLFGSGSVLREPGAVHIYEDPASDNASESANIEGDENEPPAEQIRFADVSHTSAEDDFSDNENEENDPIVHSFGPFGSNLLSRLTSFAHTSPQTKRRKTSEGESLSPSRQSQHSPKPGSFSLPEQSPAGDGAPSFKIPSPSPKRRKLPRESPIKNHVINQLAFSRVHAIPASAILRTLPADLKSVAAITTSPSGSPRKQAADSAPLSAQELRDIIQSIPCIGEISRSGKDAAGKKLENEFYYVPDRDENQMRRDAVVNGMGGTGLRSVRKNHKVCIPLPCLGQLILIFSFLAILLEEASINPLPFRCMASLRNRMDSAVQVFLPTITFLLTHHLYTT
jgi:hypothetical protein